MQPIYEHLTHKDPEVPIIFHQQYLSSESVSMIYLHWHESVELLYFYEGSGIVLSDTQKFRVNAGDLIVINSNFLHAIYTEADICRYYCMIVDAQLCRQNGINLESIYFTPKITDPIAAGYLCRIRDELKGKSLLYKTAVRLAALQLLIYLSRNHAESCPDGQLYTGHNKKADTVKAAVEYIRNHFAEDLSLTDICKNAGYNQYYFCHIFKEVTGRTVLDYLNYIRCENAKRLIVAGGKSIAECAEESGFRSQSYFTRIFKKHMGSLPSQIEREAASIPTG